MYHNHREHLTELDCREGVVHGGTSELKSEKMPHSSFCCLQMYSSFLAK